MGETADDIINGACCALCGEYFDTEYGYPVACAACWTEDCGYQLATTDDKDMPY